MVKLNQCPRLLASHVAVRWLCNKIRVIRYDFVTDPEKYAVIRDRFASDVPAAPRDAQRALFDESGAPRRRRVI